MGFKCQLIINMDTQKLFTFTVRDGNFTNVNVNLLHVIKHVQHPAIKGFVKKAIEN